MLPSPFLEVCLVVIARNEAPRIQRLLRSVSPWVDRMLVLDTGSTDDTPALAAACGARVEHFAWCDDFSAARNRALDLAGAGWHVVMDADEWLIEGGPALQALRQIRPDFIGVLQLRDSFSDKGQAREVSNWLSRILPGAVRYAGPVHEQPQHELPGRRLPVLIGHDGYQPEQLATKRGRNRALLLKALEREPQEAYLWYQLGTDCAVYEDHVQAEQGFARAAELADPGVPWWTNLVARRMFSLKMAKQHGLAMDFANAQIERCGDSPDFFFAMGDLLLDLAADEPHRAGELLPVIEQAWRQCLLLGERPDQRGAVAGRGSHLAAHNLALVLEATGRAEEARAMRSDYPVPGAG